MERKYACFARQSLIINSLLNKTMQQYRKLKVWRDSYNLVLDVYKATENFPKNEENNIIAQMRRSAMSIPANIAEGASSMFDRNFFSHLSIAYASGKEMENFLMLSKDLGYIDEEAFKTMFERLDRLNSQTYNLLQKLELRLEAKRKVKTPHEAGLKRLTSYTKLKKQG